MGSGETNNILGLRAQITANLGIIVKDAPIKILTIRTEGGYQAIVLDSRNDNVVITNANKDATNYKQEDSITEALESLLSLSSKMVLDKLRGDANDLVVPKELPPGGNSPGENPPGHSEESASDKFNHKYKHNIGEYYDITLALISLPESSVETAAEQYLKSQLKRNKEEYRHLLNLTDKVPDTDLPGRPSSLDCELGPSERWKRSMEHSKPTPGAFGNRNATGGLFGNLDNATADSGGRTTGGLFGRSVGASGLAGGSITDINASDDGFGARIKRSLEEVEKNPAAFENLSGGLFGESAHAKSAAETKITGGLFGTSQLPAAQADDLSSGLGSGFGRSAASGHSGERYPKSNLLGSPTPRSGGLGHTTNDNSEEIDDLKHWKDIADKASPPFGSSPYPPPIDLTQRSLFGSFGSRPAAKASTASAQTFGSNPPPSGFGEPSRLGDLGSKPVESTPLVSGFGSNLPTRIPGDFKPIQSSLFGVFGRTLPSHLPQSSRSDLPTSGFGSSIATKSSPFAPSGSSPFESTLPVTGSVGVGSSREPANLDKARELFGNAASTSSGFGGRISASPFGSTAISHTTRGNAPFGSQSKPSGFGSSVGGRLSGGFGHTADIIEEKEKDYLYSSDEHEDKGSDGDSEP